MIYLNISEQRKEKLRKVAEEKGISISQFVKLLLVVYLTRVENDDAPGPLVAAKIDEGNYDERLGLKSPDFLKEQLQEVADSYDMTLSEMIREIFDLYFSGHLNLPGEKSYSTPEVVYSDSYKEQMRKERSEKGG